jgi:hypothetical protein
MVADWNADCSADAPTLVVPWSDPATGAHFVDLRAEPYDIAEIHEAEQYPALGRALRALNAARSPLLTAKCDAWKLSPNHGADTLEALRLELDLDPSEAQFGFASYIDLLWRERNLFASQHRHQDQLDRIVRRAEKLPHSHAALECVLRPALHDVNGPLEGFAVTLYVTGVGTDPEAAAHYWEAALNDIVALLRGRELETPRGSATIDSAGAFPARGRSLGTPGA